MALLLRWNSSWHVQGDRVKHRASQLMIYLLGTRGHPFADASINFFSQRAGLACIPIRLFHRLFLPEYLREACDWPRLV